MRIKYLLLTTLAAVALCRSCPGASIGPPSVPVAGSKVSLGDLRAVIKMDKGEMARLESVVIAISPLPGKSRLITRKQIMQRLHRHGFAGGVQMDCPEVIQVTRSSITVAAEELVAAGESLLRELNRAQEGEELIITPITLPRDVIVAEGEIDITAEPVGSVVGRSRAGVRVSVVVEGRACYRSVLNYRLQLMSDVLVASHNLARHTRLSAAGVRRERRDLFSLRGKPLCALDESAEQRTTLRLAAGAPLTDACTEPLPLVLKGHEVTVTVLASGVVVTAPAVAKEDGARGEMIRLRTTLSKEDFSAKVVGEGRVEIRLTP